MEDIMLQMLYFLDSNGYYARTDMEKELLGILVEKGLAILKKRTKNIYLITKKGKSSIERKLHPNKNISDEELLQTIEKAYKQLSSPMNPLVRIPEVRKYVVNECKIPDSLFDSKLINFHDQGIITLQTAISRVHASDGIDSPTGIYYYMMLGA